MEQYGLGNIFKRKRKDVMRHINMFYKETTKNLKVDPANYLSQMQIEDAKKIRDYLKKKYDNTQSEELLRIINTYDVYLLSDAVPKQFKKKFFSWLVGRGDETVRKNTGFELKPDWGIRHIPEIKELITEMVDIIIDTKHAIQRLSITGPLNFEESYYYFRFLVDVEWMKSSNQYFFVNFLDFTQWDNLSNAADLLVQDAPDENILIDQPPEEEEYVGEWELPSPPSPYANGQEFGELDVAPAVPEQSLFFVPPPEPEPKENFIPRDELVKALPNIETVIEEGIDLKIRPDEKKQTAYGVYKKSLKRRYHNYYGIRRRYKRGKEVDLFTHKS
jgi:hypothetical protein